VKTEKELTRLNQYLETDKFILHDNYAEVIGDPSEEEYFSVLRLLSRLDMSIHWCVGDIAIGYKGKYGSMTRLARNVQLAPGTIHVDRYVAATYKPLWRHKSLSFEHHKIAASWPDRERWLKQAEESNWSTSEMKAARDKEKPPPSPKFDEFRRAASELLNTGDLLLQEYKRRRTPFREEFQDVIQQLLHEVEGLQFEVSITDYRYPPKPLTRRDFGLDEESDNKELRNGRTH